MMASSKAIKMPPRYILASILCSFGGFLFGMDTGIIGPVTVMKSYTSHFGSQSAITHGLIVSSILIPAALSSFFAGRLADWLGRPNGIAIGAVIFGVGTALEAGATHLAMFVAGRVVEGLGEGLYLGNLVVYICEISPPSVRGPLTTGPQLLITLGLVCGFFMCYGTATMNATTLSWRLPFLVLACLSAIFAVSAFFWLPHSPRWLSLHGRKDEATAVWDKLGVGHAEREKNEEMQSEGITDVELQNLAEGELRTESQRSVREKAKGRKSNWTDVWKKDVRMRTILAVFMMGMQQLSGIDGVLYYAPLLFQQAGLASSEASFLASGVSAIVIFAVTIPALFLCDKWGRRSSTVYGGIGVSLIMCLIGTLYASHSVHATYGAGRWVVIVSIYIFIVIFSMTWAIGIKIYAAEIQPQHTRASATSLAHGSNWLVNFLVALTTPILLSRSSFGAYFLFGGATALTAGVCAWLMPETKGKSLDEIERAFVERQRSGKKFAAVLRRVKGFWKKTGRIEEA